MSQYVPLHDRLYYSGQVAKILRISHKTLYRMLADGRLPEPMRDPRNNYRLWTEVDLQMLRHQLASTPQELPE